MLKLFNNKKNKEKTEIVVVDNNKELPDIRKIAIPDLKQYILKGYEEIREIKTQNHELEEKLEDAKKYKDLYETALVTTGEFEKRDEENKQIIKKKQEKIDKYIEENSKLQEIINTYKILEKDIETREKEITNKYNEIKNEGIIKYKDNLIEKINNTKGNISKSKLIMIVNEVEKI